MRIFLAAAALLLFSGCGSDETPSATGDGKIHPPPSGVRTTETLACSALSDAHSKTILALGCAGTARTCPALIRAQSGVDCLEYDKGSLDACVAHIKEQTACTDVGAAVDDCVVYAYADSAPAGCP